MSLDAYPSNEEILRKLAERKARTPPPGPFDYLGAGYVGVDLRGMAPVPQKRPAKTRSVPTEHQEQVTLFKWIDEDARHLHPEFGYIFAIPNGAYRSPAIAGKSKAEGQRPGYPDIAWDLCRGGYTGFRGELKRKDKGAVSPLQQEWHIWLERQGLYVCTTHGWEAMRDELLNYFSSPISHET